MAHRRLGHRFEDDWSEKELRDIYGEVASAVTIPVNVKIEGKHKVLEMSRVDEILKGSRLITISDCGCRRDHRNCSSPLDVCISLDEEADSMLKSGSYNVRRATLDEARDALKRAHEAGLVLMAYTLAGSDKISPICSCCSCCCHTLSGLVRFGIAKHVLSSDLVSVTDDESCTDCGICADRCQFAARRMIDGKMTYDNEQCFGCGLCVSFCPTKAISLVERKN